MWAWTWNGTPRPVSLTDSRTSPAARTADSARFDCRVTGATETVRNFDRLALVIEGFEHLREIFEGVRAQVREDFGLADADQAAATGLDARV